MDHKKAFVMYDFIESCAYYFKSKSYEGGNQDPTEDYPNLDSLLQIIEINLKAHILSTLEALEGDANLDPSAESIIAHLFSKYTLVNIIGNKLPKIFWTLCLRATTTFLLEQFLEREELNVDIPSTVKLIKKFQNEVEYLSDAFRKLVDSQDLEIEMKNLFLFLELLNSEGISAAIDALKNLVNHSVLNTNLFIKKAAILLDKYIDEKKKKSILEEICELNLTQIKRASKENIGNLEITKVKKKNYLVYLSFRTHIYRKDVIYRQQESNRSQVNTR